MPSRRRSLAIAAALALAAGTPIALRAQAAPPRPASRAAPRRVPAPVVAPLLAITDVTVIDVLGGRRLPHRTVVVRDGQIRMIGLAGPDGLPIPADARVLDGSGAFLVPGLWDAHVHLDLGDSGNRAVALPLLVAHGVTGVREAWSDCVGCDAEGDGRTPLEAARTLRADVQAGRTAGPRLVLTGAPLDGPGGPDEGTWIVRTAAEARAAVDSTAARELSGVNSYSWLGPAPYRAAAARAREKRLPLGGPPPAAATLDELRAAGHRLREGVGEWTVACSGVGDSVRAALRAAASADSAGTPPLGEGAVERVRQATRARLHATFDPARCVRVVPRLGGVGWQVPRLTHARPALALRDATDDPALQYLPASALAGWRDTRAHARTDTAVAEAARQRAIVGVLARAGVRIAVGTETYAGANLWGAAVHDEMAALADAGLTPLQVLRAATIEAARAVGAADSTGSVEPGKAADLVLLDADPLADVANVRRVRAVVVGGRAYDRTALDALLATARRFARGDTTSLAAIADATTPSGGAAGAAPVDDPSTRLGRTRISPTVPADTAPVGAAAPFDSAVVRATPVPARPGAGALPAAPARARAAVVADTVQGVALPDPYRWLEDARSPERGAFVEAQRAYARGVLGALPPVDAAGDAAGGAALGAGDVTSARLEVTLPDGARIPVTIVHRRGTQPDGSAPLLLEARAAGAPPLDLVQAPLVRAWLADGGVYALAYARPGAPAAGDVLAAAEALVARRWTRAGRLALLGSGSAAAPVAVAALVRPALAGAVLVDGGVPDAVRAAQRAARPGAAGDLATAESVRGLVRVSPYRRVPARAVLPAFLVTGAGADAAQAKLVARLQAANAGARPNVWWVRGAAGSGALRDDAGAVPTVVGFARTFTLPR